MNWRACTHDIQALWYLICCATASCVLLLTEGSLDRVPIRECSKSAADSVSYVEQSKPLNMRTSLQVFTVRRCRLEHGDQVVAPARDPKQAHRADAAVRSACGFSCGCRRGRRAANAARDALAEERRVDAGQVVSHAYGSGSIQADSLHGHDDSREHISILALSGKPLFFQHFDGPYFPTLRLLHQCA